MRRLFATQFKFYLFQLIPKQNGEIVSAAIQDSVNEDSMISETVENHIIPANQIPV